MKKVIFTLVCSLAVLVSVFIASGQSTVNIEQENQIRISSNRQEQLKAIIEIEQQVTKLKQDVQTTAPVIKRLKSLSEQESREQISKEVSAWQQTIQAINLQITYLSEVTNQQKADSQANIKRIKAIYQKTEI